MTKPIGYWLKELDRLIERNFERLLTAEHLTRRHWQVLNTVATGPSTRGEIDEALRPFLTTEQPSAAPVVDDLLARGWLAEAGDRLMVTGAGSAAHARLTDRVRAERMRLTEGITAEEYRAVVATLERMANNLAAR